MPYFHRRGGREGCGCRGVERLGKVGWKEGGASLATAIAQTLPL